MDVMAGLAAVSNALDIARTLRTIDKTYDLATVKAQMADIYMALGDAKIALSDARDGIATRDQQIKDLQRKLEDATTGDACPLCDGGRMKVIASVPDPDFGDFGLMKRTLECQGCGHSEPRQFDPTGVLKGK
jgi:hypothetical protein